jgi:hypothetical protein
MRDGNIYRCGPFEIDRKFASLFISWPESVEDESEEHEEALYFVNFVFFVVEIVLDWVWDLELGIWDLSRLICPAGRGIPA